MKVKDIVTGNELESASDIVTESWKAKPERFKPVGGKAEQAQKPVLEEKKAGAKAGSASSKKS